MGDRILQGDRIPQVHWDPDLEEDAWSPSWSPWKRCLDQLTDTIHELA